MVKFEGWGIEHDRPGVRCDERVREIDDHKLNAAAEFRDKFDLVYDIMFGHWVDYWVGVVSPTDEGAKVELRDRELGRHQFTYYLKGDFQIRGPW